MRLACRAHETPDAIVLLAPSRESLTWRHFAAHVQNSKEMFERAGVEPGDVTAVVLPNGPELITTFFASTALGASAPLDPALTEDEYRFYLSRLRARTLILLDGAALPAASAARWLGMRIVSIRARVDQAVGVFEIVDAGIAPAAELGRKTDAALLLFTSATTDSPKLVPLTWPNLRSIAAFDSRALGLTAQDRLLSLMPLFHLHGLAAALTQLFAGGSVISVPKFDPASFLAWLAELRPTWLCSNPPMSRALLTLASSEAGALKNSSLRFIRSGTGASEPGLLDALEKAMGVPVVDGYGMTETGGITRNTTRSRRPGSVGQSSGLEVAIVEGEIVVRGPSVTSGYLDNPEANALAFRDGWFHTGDMGHLDEDGFLFITGRLKELINRGGKKVSPQEVEAALLAHPAVAEAAACAIPHATLGEDVAAAVVLREGSAASESELRRFSATRLAPFKVPRRIALIDAIPRTSTGKPRRSQLTEQLRNVPPAEAAARRAPDPVESILIDIWRRILGVERIEVTSDFFALGGDSLRAATMLTEVQRTLRTSAALLDRIDFFDDPTIKSLARIAEECGAELTAPDAGGLRILPLRRTGSGVPMFCFPASAQDPYYFRHLSKKLAVEQPLFVVCHPEPIRDGRLLPVEDLARSCVEAIRSERPGPYILAGHCYGGVVAFETALQLMAQGQTVVRLVLFDVATPGYPKIHKQWKRYAMKAGEAASAWQRGKSAITAKELRRHLHMLGHIFARRRKGNVSRVLTAIGSDTLTAGRQPKELNGMAMWEYTPRPFDAPIVHFIAADQPVSTEVLSDPRLGWNDFARAGLETHYVRGDHNTILAVENVGRIAEQLSAMLSHPALAGGVAANGAVSAAGA